MSKKISNVLLVNPWIYDFAAYDFWVKPLGLLSIASVLRKNGYALSLIDCLESTDVELADMKGITKATPRRYGAGHFFKEHVEKPHILSGIPRYYSRYGISPELFEKKLQSIPQPEVMVVTSMMDYWYPGVFLAISLCKKYYPQVPLVLGGIYATLCPDHARRYSGADCCIYGEGEAALLKKVVELTQGSISFVPSMNDFDSLPFPALDLLSNLDSLCILTARGCPYRCTYCASSLLNNSFRHRASAKVIDEIVYWKDRYPVRNVAFYDDALLYRAGERFIPLVKEIITRDIGCNFHTPNGLHIRGITQEVSELLFQAWFKTIRLGLETSDEARQMSMGEKVTNREFEQAVRYLREAGYESKDIGVYLLVGFPGQSVEEVRRSIQFVKDCGARPYLAEYSPIPGTGLWKEALRTSPFDLEDEPLFHNNSILPCRSEQLSWEDLYQLKQEVKMVAQ